MITPIRSLLLSVFALLILSGCVADSNNNAGNERVGYFIDAQVNGLVYVTTSGKKGTTNSLGKFFYQSGESITFSIGNLELGTAKPNSNGLITPQSLAENTWKKADKQNTMEVLMLRLLQSLDIDKQNDNGITISPQIAFQLSTLPKIKLSELTETKLLALSDDLRQAVDTDSDGRLDVTETIAKAHAKKSLTSWNLGKRPKMPTPNSQKNKTKSDSEIDYGERSQQASSLNKQQKFSLAYLWQKQKLASNLYSSFQKNFDFYLLSSNATAGKVYQQKLESIIKHYDLNINDLDHFSGSYSASELSAIAKNNYAIQSIQDEFDHLIKRGKSSLNDALQAACMHETTKIDELDRFIELANIPYNNQLAPLFKHLQKQSYQQHWELGNTLKQRGFVQGCASMGAAYKKLDYENLSINSQVNYYLIYGNTAREVRNIMNQNSKRPKPYDAYTQWSVNWHYTWQQSNGHCKVSTANADVKIKMLLPKLSNLMERPKALREQWSAYITALTEHENGHRDIGINVANDTLQHILKTPPKPSCSALQTAVSQVIAQRISASKDNDKIYDKATNHGLNEGAEFH